MKELSKFLVKLAQITFLRGLKSKKPSQFPSDNKKLYAKNVELFFKESKYCPKTPNIIKDKVAFVIGGTSTLGVMCIKELLREGVKATMIADTNETRGRDTLEELSADYKCNRFAFIKTDPTNVKLLRNAFHWTKKHFGGIDIVVNVANEIEYAPWVEQVEKNLKGIVRSTLLGYEYLGIQNGGSGGYIINVITTSSLSDKKIHPIAVGIKYYVTNFGKAMSEKYQDLTGVKIISGICNSDEGSIYEEMLPILGINNDMNKALKGKTLREMLKLSDSGSVWMFQCLRSDEEEKERT